MISAAAQFRKSGFNDADAATLAKVATQFQNVSDTAISAEDAAASIVSQIRAFGEDASFAQTVVDAYNEVANNFSVGTNDLSAAMEVAASGLATYGNEFSEILGLVTSGSEILQGRSLQVARGLSTIAARIAKNQDALAEYGITVENVDGSLKSTYDVLAELSEKWESMTDAQKTALGDTIAGTNQYKVLAAVMQNFATATAATETALNSAGSATLENSKYMESLAAKEQLLKAEFEDFANRVLSKELVSGFYDVTQAALEFINTDFGAATTRIAGVTAGITSLVGIVGAFGAKMTIVGKQLSAVGAGGGILELLTTPKTLLIIGGVVAAIAGLVEVIRAVNQAVEDAKFENRLEQLEETKGKITETKNSIVDLQEQLNKLNEIDSVDRSSTWAKETEELKRQLEAAKALLEIEEKRRKIQEAETYTSDRVVGVKVSPWDGAAVYSQYDENGPVSGAQIVGLTGEYGLGSITKEQVAALNKEYANTEEALRAIGVAFSDALSEKQYEKLVEAISSGDVDAELEVYRELLVGLQIGLDEVSVSSDEYAQRQSVLIGNLASNINATGEMTKAQKENAEAYISSNNGLYQYIKTLSSTSYEQSQFVEEYERLAKAIVEYNLTEGLMDTSDAVLYLTNTMGYTTEAAVGVVNGLNSVGSSAKQSTNNFVKLTDGTIALKENCEEITTGIWKLKDGIDNAGNSAQNATSNLYTVSDAVTAAKISMGLMAEASKVATNALYDTAAQVNILSNTNLNTAQKIQALQELTNAAYAAQGALSQVLSGSVKENYQRFRQAGLSESEALAKAQQAESARYQRLFGDTDTTSKSTPFGGGGSSTTSTKSAAKIAAEAAVKAAQYKVKAIQEELDLLNDQKTALEDEISNIQEQVEAEYQVEIDVLNKRKDAIEESYDAWKEDADAVLDRLEEEKDAIQAVIDALDKQKEELEAATAYATEYASREIDEIDKRLEELDTREEEINKKYDDELDKLKETNDELDKQIEREKLLKSLAEARATKKRVYTAGQGYILVDNIAAISKAQAELDKFDREQKQSLEEQEIEAKRKQELIDSGIEAERESLKQQKELWEEYSKKWSSIVSEYEYNQNRLIYIQRYGNSIENQTWNQRNNTVEQAAKEYNDIMAQYVAEQERLAAKETEIKAQEAEMDAARIENQKAVAAIEKEISDLQDEMVAAQEARVERQKAALESLADSIEETQRRLNEAQSDYDEKSDISSALDEDKPYIRKQVGGKAPSGSKVGDFIVTAGGTWLITGGYDGHWKSTKVADATTVKEAIKELLNAGYISSGNYGYAKGTTSATPGLHMLGENGPELGVLSQGDGVIPADITKTLMNFGSNPDRFINSALSKSVGDVIMQGVTLTFPNVRDGSDAAAFTKNFVNLAHQYAYKR